MCNSLTVVDGWNPVHGWNVDAESWMDLWKSSRFQQNQFFPPLDWLDPWVQPSCSGAGADFIQAMPGTTPTRKSIKMDNVNVSERGYVQEHWEKRDDGIVPQQWLTPWLLEYHLSLFGKMELIPSFARSQRGAIRVEAPWARIWFRWCYGTEGCLKSYTKDGPQDFGHGSLSWWILEPKWFSFACVVTSFPKWL